MDLRTISDHIHAVVNQGDSIALVYLFGSRAEQSVDEGSVGPMSDYDFGLLVDRGADGPAIRSAFAHAMAKRLTTDRIDVVLLHTVPVELAHSVIAQGRLLFERDRATRVEYEASVMGRYGDYLPVLRAQRLQILEGGDYAKRVQRYRETLRRTRRTLGEITSSPD